MSVRREMATDAMPVNPRGPEVGSGPAGTERGDLPDPKPLGGAETVAPPVGTCCGHMRQEAKRYRCNTSLRGGHGGVAACCESPGVRDSRTGRSTTMHNQDGHLHEPSHDLRSESLFSLVRDRWRRFIATVDAHRRRRSVRSEPATARVPASADGGPAHPDPCADIPPSSGSAGARWTTARDSELFYAAHWGW
jgi:hypothetical protein